MTVLESVFYPMLMAIFISGVVAVGDLYNELVEMRAAVAIVANAYPVVWENGELAFDCNARYANVDVNPFNKGVEVACTAERLVVTVKPEEGSVLRPITATLEPFTP